MSSLIFRGTTVRLSDLPKGFSEGTGRLVIEVSLDESVVDNTSLRPRQSDTSVWEADDILLLNEIDMAVTISLMMEIGQGERQRLGSVELYVRDLYETIGKSLEVPMISDGYQLELIVKTEVDLLTMEELEKLYPHRAQKDDSSSESDTLRAMVTDALNLIRDFERDKKLQSMDKAISRLQFALTMASADPSQLPKILSLLGACNNWRFTLVQDVNDIHNAVQRLGAAVDLTSDGHPDKLRYTETLASSLLARFDHLGQTADIDGAVSRQQTAVDLTPIADAAKPRRLTNLGASLLKRFSRFGNPEDINNAVIQYQAAVSLTKDGHPEKPRYLNNLGTSLQARFRRFGDPIDINNAIASQQASVRLMPDGHPDKPTCLTSLGTSLQRRFDTFGNLEDIDDAIKYKQSSVELITPDHPHKPACLNNLGTCLQTRFLRFGNVIDIDNAIKQKQAAVSLTPNNHPDKPLYLSNLGNSLERRFERLGDLRDLDDAIAQKKAAVDLAPHGHPEKHRYISNLAKALDKRFRRFGNIVDIDDAIAQYEIAVDLIPDGHPDKPMCLNNFGNSLEARFGRLHNLMDLEKAVQQEQAAVDLTRDDHPDKPMFLNNLGISLHARFMRIGSKEDLNNSIMQKQRAIDLSPDGHPRKASHCTNLAASLRARFELLGNITDLDDAITQAQAAVNLTPDDHSNKPMFLNNLGASLELRFDRFGNVADIDTIISQQKWVVELTPDEHSSKSLYLMSLGRHLMKRFQRSQNREDAESSIHHLSLAANSSLGPPTTRFAAAQLWISAASTINHVSLLSAYDCAISIMPLVAWLGLPIADRHQYLTRIGGTTREAAAAAISLEEYDKALEWLEQGRSIVWNQILQLRSPLDRLGDVDPDLANRLLQISRLLDSDPKDAGIQDTTQVSIEQRERRYRSLTTERETLIQKVRSIPSFEDFLRSTSVSGLMDAARNGPVVVLNAAKNRCDALALLPGLDDVVHIPLPGFTNEKAIQLQQDLKDLLSTGGIRAHPKRAAQRMGDIDDEEDFKYILAELWNGLVKPVLDSLAFSAHPDVLPRIWWCPTGPLAFLPIHAAGIYDQDSTQMEISDYVISSYTPTISALLEPPNTCAATSPFRLLSIAEPSAPGASYIPNTKIEQEYIRACLGDRGHVALEGPSATKRRVVKEMKDSNWAHFACHGVQNPLDPTRSALLLHDSPMTLGEIIRLDLPKAEFAFLSACQTITGDESLSDEAAHIAGGMLLAGYRSVVATMWSIQDDLAPKVTNQFYTSIIQDDGRPNNSKAAEGLHYSIQRLRREDKVPLTSWIPFVHVGI